jgi:membrane protein
MLIRRKLRRTARKAARFAYYVVLRFFDDRCPQVASSLSFTTLLAAIPLAAVGLSVTAKLPLAPALRNEVQRFVLVNFVPEVGAAVDRTIDDLLANAGRLTTFGVIGLFFSAFIALITIQGAFDQIWRVPASGLVAVRALILLIVLCIGPELVGVGLLVPAYLLQLANAAGFAPWMTPLTGIVVLAPPLLEVVGLGLIYILLPRPHVRFREGLSGALVATVLLEGGKFGFIRYIAGFTDYKAVYGALSILPVLLLWIYLAWLAVLFGAVVAASMPTSRDAPSPP